MSEDFLPIVVYSLLISTGIVILYFGYKYLLAFLGVRKKGPQKLYANLDPFAKGPLSGTQKWVLDLPEEQQISLTIKDFEENDVHTLVDAKMDKGNHIVSFDTTMLDDGIYYCELLADGYKVQRRIQIANRK